MTSPAQSRRASAGALLLALVIGFGASRGVGFREDELECEEAAAHLAECCPSLDVSRISCTYSEGCGSPTLPILSSDTARCIRELDCDGVHTRGWCDPEQYQAEQPIESCP